VHIDAAMRALYADLAPTAKHALLVVAARANQTTGQLTRSVAGVAEDMGVSVWTARRALHAATEAGYLQVIHSVGISSTYTVLPLANLRGVTPSKSRRVPLANTAPTPSKSARVKRKPTNNNGRHDPQRVGALLKTHPARGGSGSTWVPDRRPLDADGDC
jgi:hypothetical protein